LVQNMNPERIAIVGAGNMGSGIAQKIATEGYPVVLVDLNEEAAQMGYERIRTLLGEAVERKIFRPEQVEEILGRIELATDLKATSRCRLVIEAVFEDLDVKRDLFQKLDECCSESTILATNTSSFYVRDLAAATKRPDRVVGLHYFFHPAKNRLVEVVPCENTSEATRSWCWTFNEIIGKTPIHSADAPGFVVNRYFVQWINESVRLLEEGIADIATIEAAAKDAFRIGMGPFELMNVTGIPISLHAATTLGRELGDFYAPCDRLAAKVAGGGNWDFGGEADESKFAPVAQRLLGVIFQIAGELVDAKVSTIEDIDIGARVGLRWALGPFELANRVGIDETHACVKALGALYPSLKMPRCIEAQHKAKQPFAFELVKMSVHDGLAEISLNRPDAMNALNEAVVGQLAKCFDEADGRKDIRTIVLRGTGKAFVAGADIRFFVKNIKAGDFDRLLRFTQTGQELYRRIDESEKQVIVRLDGLSLGGGSELALCADRIVATPKGSLGFPETGIGIYPGLGGTQRSQRRCGRALARYLILTGETVDAQTAARMGLVDEVVGPDRIDARIAELHAAGKQPSAKPALDDRLRALEKFFSDAKLEALLDGSATAADPAVSKSAGRVRHKAPIATRLADAMIRTGAEKGEDAGLKMELDKLGEIFHTTDALEGLSSLGRRWPEFKGQ
jgi:enoyl-CoA hydratase/3-hydroxyacyl-CoA dehydrogenase